MQTQHLRFFIALVFCVLTGIAAAQSQSTGNPLPSWNDGDAKPAIIDFVTRVTDQNSPEFVPVPQRIATFDNDGTLWSEQPLYFQALFALDRRLTAARAAAAQRAPA